MLPGRCPMPALTDLVRPSLRIVHVLQLAHCLGRGTKLERADTRRSQKRCEGKVVVRRDDRDCGCQCLPRRSSSVFSQVASWPRPDPRAGESRRADTGSVPLRSGDSPSYRSLSSLRAVLYPAHPDPRMTSFSLASACELANRRCWARCGVARSAGGRCVRAAWRIVSIVSGWEE